MHAAVQWFRAAGFEDVQIKRIGPKWYRGVRRHGLIMGCSVTGKKSQVIRILLELGFDAGAMLGFFCLISPHNPFVIHLRVPRRNMRSHHKTMHSLSKSSIVRCDLQLIACLSHRCS